MEGYIAQALEIVKAQASVRPMSEEEIMSMTKRLANDLQKITEGVTDPQEETPACDPKKAIKEKSVTCCECGRVMKVITKKHLAVHDLTPEEYKEKYGYKKGTPLIAKQLGRERRKKMQEMELWKRREGFKEPAKKKRVKTDAAANPPTQESS